MTAINITADIPSNINTLEKLAAWVGLALARVNPTAKVLETPGTDPVRVCECITIKDDAGVYRLVVRVTLPLSDSYAEATSKFWESCTEVGTVAIPAAFKSN